LYMIAKCSLDQNDRIRNQVPEELRESKTLILAPASLLKNWRDKFNKWIPFDEEEGEYECVGKLRILDSSVNEAVREQMLSSFNESGGVLLIGYHLFTRTLQKVESAKDILLRGPNLVIADEAHFFKN